MWAKVSLPIGRMARSRPATVTVTGSVLPAASAVIEGCQGFLRGVGDVRAGGVGLHPGFAQAFGLFQADLFEVGSFHE